MAYTFYLNILFTLNHARHNTLAIAWVTLVKRVTPRSLASNAIFSFHRSLETRVNVANHLHSSPLNKVLLPSAV